MIDAKLTIKNALGPIGASIASLSSQQSQLKVERSFTVHLVGCSLAFGLFPHRKKTSFFCPKQLQSS